MRRSVEIVEVGPRDGLQNEQQVFTVKQRQGLVLGLARAGLRRIEVGAFVSPRWVPQMADTGELVSELEDSAAAKDCRFSVLVPNPKGMELALKTRLKEVAIFGACSESFSQKNINCSIEESFSRFAEVLRMAKGQNIKVRGYLSTAFGCPYEGLVSEGQVVKLAERMLALGVYEVSIGDTIGVATPLQVTGLVNKLLKKIPPRKLALHFHDTRGTALANVYAGLQLGIGVFDSSLGGLGGCPYAQGASGNLATEDLVYMLSSMGIKTGVDLAALIELSRGFQAEVGHRLPSRVMQAGLPHFTWR